MRNNETIAILSERLSKLIEIKKDEDYRMSETKQAEEMNIPYQTFHKYVMATAECSAGNLVKIAQYYNVSTDYLLGLTDIQSNDNDIKNACEVTGLSENVINKIIQKRDWIIIDVKSGEEIPDEKICSFEMLNKVLLLDEFYELINCLDTLEQLSDKYNHSLFAFSLKHITHFAKQLGINPNKLISSLVSFHSIINVEDLNSVYDSCDVYRYRVLKGIEQISNIFDCSNNYLYYDKSQIIDLFKSSLFTDKYINEMLNDNPVLFSKETAFEYNEKYFYLNDTQ